MYLLFDARHVFNAINAAKEKDTIKRSERLDKLELELGQTSLHLATRANILRTAIGAMNRQMEELIEIVKNATDPPECAIKVPGPLVYGLLLHTDSFFFEAKAFEESLREFFLTVAKRMLNYSSKVAKEMYEEITSQSGVVDEEPWSRFLFRVRRKFIHNAAPWVVVDVSRSGKGVFDFLILSENIKDFALASPNSFLPAVRDMNQLWACLTTMAQAIERILIDRISEM
jgi:hypothetical protein